MTNIPSLPQRKSIRLPGYDYTQAGAYFITLVTWQRECLFGEVVAGEMQLTKLGEMVDSEWKRIEKRFPTVELDEWVVMPNHFHGIIVLAGTAQRNPKDPTREGFRSPVAGSIPTILRSFKSSVTQWAKGAGLGTAIWHRNYYEHVIRDELEYSRIRFYIQENPRRWAEDEENLTQL